jgi:hypothetical protein
VLGGKMSTGSDLTLTIPRNKLGEFIGSLLGQQRKIERSFEGGHFVATHDWILNIIDIFEQRMSQNPHSLISFRCRFFFDDGRIYTVETIDAFCAYTDLSNKTTVGVDISVTYAVDFPGTEIPGKQEIRVEVFSDIRVKENASRQSKSKKQARIQYMVSFTNLTFGEDVSRHISSYIETIYKRDWVTKALCVSSVDFVSIIAVFFMILGFTIAFLLHASTNEFTEKFKNIEQYYTPEAQSEKLNIIIHNYMLQNDPAFIFIMLAAMFASVAVFTCALLLLRRLNTSIVIFNRYTETKSISFLRLNEYIKWAVCAAILVGTIGSLIAARIDRLFS